ncbi:MAG: hypothetical protein AAGE52_31665 [Myxococcota bacterium]
MTIFAYHGREILMAEGADVLAHDGSTEAPTWSASLGAPVLGLATWTEGSVAVSESGEGRRFGPSGDEVERFETDGAVGFAAATLSPHWAVLGGTAVHRSGGGPVDLPGPATAIAVAENGSVAVGGNGSFWVLEEEWVAVSLPHVEVRHIHAVADGSWLVCNGPDVLRVRGESATRLPIDLEQPPTFAAQSPDGQTIAVVWGDVAVTLVDPAGTSKGQIIYGDKTVTGVAFGPSPWLGVGLSGGDGNKINLATGAVHRTDTHPGRQHNRWMLLANVGPGAIPPKAATAERTPEQDRRDTILGLVILGVIAAGALWYFLS